MDHVDALIEKAQRAMQSVLMVKQYARMVDNHLRSGGPADVYLHDPGRWHSLLGVACHKGAVQTVQQLLLAGAKTHWPVRDIPNKALVAKRKEERESEEYDGLHLDPLSICMDAIGWSCMEANQWGRDCDEDIFHHDIDRQVECLKLLLANGADPGLRDPAYRTMPADSIMRYIQSKNHGQLNEEVEGVFLDIVTSMATHRPSQEDTRAMAEGRWVDVPWMELPWQTSFPRTAAKLQAWAQQSLLSTLTPSTPQTARPRF